MWIRCQPFGASVSSTFHRPRHEASTNTMRLHVLVPAEPTKSAIVLPPDTASARLVCQIQQPLSLRVWPSYSAGLDCWNGTVVRSELLLAAADRGPAACEVPIRFAAYYPNNVEEISRLAEESSIPTHASDQCRSACRYLATVLAALIQGEDRGAVLSPTWKPLRTLNDIKPLHPTIHQVAQGSFRDKQPPAIQGSGWVVKSLEAALWAFHDASTFEEAVLKAVNLGDDADTTGAICGQLAGAYWGEANIPSSLRSGLARMDMVEKALVGIVGG
jgi:ADP-ribosylglycohydrolase